MTATYSPPQARWQDWDYIKWDEIDPESLISARERDAWLAARFLGWTDVQRTHTGDWSGLPPGRQYRRCVREFTTALTEAWKVIDLMRERGTVELYLHAVTVVHFRPKSESLVVVGPLATSLGLAVFGLAQKLVDTEFWSTPTHGG